MSKDVDNWVWTASISIRYPKWLAVAQTTEKDPTTIPTAQKWTFAPHILSFPMTDSFNRFSELKEEDMWEYLWNWWSQQVTVFCLPDSVALVIYPNWQEMQAQRNKPPANLPIAFGGPNLVQLKGHHTKHNSTAVVFTERPQYTLLTRPKHSKTYHNTPPFYSTS